VAFLFDAAFPSDFITLFFLDSMISLQKITSADIAWYSYAEELLVTSFPVEEYRELAEQRHRTDHSSSFSLQIILLDSSPVGFISWWNFTDFLYIEHLAIDPLKRNIGIGEKVLYNTRQLVKLPIVLETELPVTEISKRRIAFYQRNGLQLWERDYLQPPYRKGFPFLPLKLMATIELDCTRDYDRIISVIYREVYGVNEDQQ